MNSVPEPWSAALNNHFTAQPTSSFVLACEQTQSSAAVSRSHAEQHIVSRLASLAIKGESVTPGAQNPGHALLYWEGSYGLPEAACVEMSPLLSLFSFAWLAGSLEGYSWDPAGFDQNTVWDLGNVNGIRDLTKIQCGIWGTLTRYGIWLLPGGRNLAKFGNRIRDGDSDDRRSGCGIFVKKEKKKEKKRIGNVGSGPLFLGPFSKP